jgi:hypothetical protein
MDKIEILWGKRESQGIEVNFSINEILKIILFFNHLFVGIGLATMFLFYSNSDQFHFFILQIFQFISSLSNTWCFKISTIKTKTLKYKGKNGNNHRRLDDSTTLSLCHRTLTVVL